MNKRTSTHHGFRNLQEFIVHTTCSISYIRYLSARI